jgi:hypothetical protein
MATSDEPELAGPAASTEHGRPGDDLWLERGMLRKPLKGLAQPLPGTIRILLLLLA